MLHDHPTTRCSGMQRNQRNALAMCIFQASVAYISFHVAPSAKPQCGGGATISHCHRSPCGATCAVGEILGMAVPPNQQGQAWCQWGGQVRGWSAWWRRSTFSSRSSLADHCDTGALHCPMTQREPGARVTLISTTSARAAFLNPCHHNSPQPLNATTVLCGQES